MKTLTHALAAAALLATTGAAQAYMIAAVNGNGNVVDTSLSSATMLSVAIDATSRQPAQLSISQEATDGAVLRLNGLLRNLTGLPLGSVSLVLEGATWAFAGDAAGTFGSVATVTPLATATGAAALIEVSPPEFFELRFGDWFQDASGRDFGIDLANAAPSFTLSVTQPHAVAEPHSLALATLALLAMAGLGRGATASRQR